MSSNLQAVLSALGVEAVTGTDVPPLPEGQGRRSQWRRVAEALRTHGEDQTVYLPDQPANAGASIRKHGMQYRSSDHRVVETNQLDDEGQVKHRKVADFWVWLAPDLNVEPDGGSPGDDPDEFLYEEEEDYDF